MEGGQIHSHSHLVSAGLISGLQPISKHQQGDPNFPDDLLVLPGSSRYFPCLDHLLSGPDLQVATQQVTVLKGGLARIGGTLKGGSLRRKFQGMLNCVKLLNRLASRMAKATPFENQLLNFCWGVSQHSVLGNEFMIPMNLLWNPCPRHTHRRFVTSHGRHQATAGRFCLFHFPGSSGDTEKCFEHHFLRLHGHPGAHLVGRRLC